jgi:hypothetical protein
MLGRPRVPQDGPALSLMSTAYLLCHQLLQAGKFHDRSVGGCGVELLEQLRLLFWIGWWIHRAREQALLAPKHCFQHTLGTHQR